MANINYLRSVSPLFNVMSHVAAGDQILGGLGSLGARGGTGKMGSGAVGGGNPGETVTPAAGGGGGGGPLSGNPLRAAVLGQDQPADPGGNEGEQQAPLAGGPTQYRPPTQVYQGKGQGFRDTTAEERSEYNQHWLGDRRNVGYGAGQVDPGLARAARMQEKENSGGGGGK